MSSFLLFCVVLCAAVVVHAPAPEGAPAASVSPRHSLGAAIDAVLTATSPRGFSGGVLVARRDERLYERAAGLPGRSAPTLASQYVIGSISKQMTAALVLRAAAQNRVELDAPLRTYLPDLTDEWADQVSIAQLLNHTSGIDTLGRPLLHRAGSVFAYSNFSYLLLGRLLERVRGQPFALQAEEMFAHCGMKDSLMPPQSESLRTLPRLMPGLVERGDGRLWPWSAQRNVAHNPSGGAVSTLGDLVRWNACLHQGKWISGPFYQAMITPAATAQRSHRWGKLGYGYGLQVSEHDGLLELSHSGYVEGYLSTLLYYPVQQLSVVVLEHVSWLDSPPERTFAVHDRVRSLVRESLRAGTVVAART
ncbi:serine hydrolase domain-containing protein [Chitinimonas lacunae]|uniref:Serine hydrolase domain-containing protein n=1 Tax=Chitinimonas lacunae TaxID=1963018 RepID=A0ABV8MR58_9NEIS